MDFELKDARPIWQQLAELIEREIITGSYPPGSRFPSVRDLAVQAGVNPNTMQRALAALEETGLLFSERTSGRTVTADGEIIARRREEAARKLVRDYTEAMQRLGYDRSQAAAMAAEEREEQ